MKIDIPDNMVEEIIVKELQWAYERSYDMNEDEDADLEWRTALRTVLAYFMPVHQQHAYFNLIEKKYER